MKQLQLFYKEERRFFFSLFLLMLVQYMLMHGFRRLILQLALK